jgi:hypothetical protein
MTSYGARIFDLSLGRFVFSAPSLASPGRVGQVAAGAMVKLVVRDGRRAEDLELRPFVAEGSRLRRMTASEEAAMNAAVEGFAEEMRAA